MLDELQTKIYAQPEKVEKIAGWAKIKISAQPEEKGEKDVGWATDKDLWPSLDRK